TERFTAGQGPPYVHGYGARHPRSTHIQGTAAMVRTPVTSPEARAIHTTKHGAARGRLPGVCAAWMPRSSPHGWVHGVPREPSPGCAVPSRRSGPRSVGPPGGNERGVARGRPSRGGG